MTNLETFLEQGGYTELIQYANRLLRDPDQAADVVQEVMEWALEDTCYSPEKGTYKGWLKLKLWCLVKNHYNLRTLERETLAQYFQEAHTEYQYEGGGEMGDRVLVPVVDGVEGKAREQELYEAIMEVVRTYPPKERAIIVMGILEAEPYETGAGKGKVRLQAYLKEHFNSDRPLNSLRVTVSQLRKELKQKLARFAPDGYKFAQGTPGNRWPARCEAA